MGAYSNTSRLSLLLSSFALTCAGGDFPADPSIESVEFVTINGRVLTQPDGQPLDEALVRVEPAGNESSTDANGSFEFRDLEIGPVTYIVMAHKAGFATATRSLLLDGRTTEVSVEIRLSPISAVSGAIEITDCEGKVLSGKPWRELAFGLDADLARLAEEVPGFGGLFLDRGKLSVYLLDLRARDQAEPAFRGYLARVGAQELRWLQGGYDWRQLVVWRRCLSNQLSAIEGFASSDIDEKLNRIAFGFSDDQAIAAAEAALVGTAVPRDAVLFERRGPICTLAGIASVLAEIRDETGQPAAIGATVTIRKAGNEWTDEGYGDSLRIAVHARNEGGIFEVRIRKPWHAETVLPRVEVPEGVCGVSAPKVVQATISLVPEPPSVRQVVLPPFGYGLGGSICGSSHPITAYVLAADGVSREAVWLSRDESVVKVERTVRSGTGGDDAQLIPQCRRTAGETYVVAMSAADPTVRDSVQVSVGGR